MYDDEALLAVGIITIIVLIVILLPLCILYIIGRWKIFKKAGKNGWEAIVPFYNDWVYVEISGLNNWWFFIIIASTICTYISEDLSSIASLASTFGLFVCNYNIAKRMKQSTSMAVLMTLFPMIVIPMLGISKKYTFDINIPVSKNGPFGNNNNTTNTYNENNQTNNNISYCPNCGNKLNSNEKFCSNCGKEVQ